MNRGKSREGETFPGEPWGVWQGPGGDCAISPARVRAWAAAGPGGEEGTEPSPGSGARRVTRVGLSTCGSAGVAREGAGHIAEHTGTRTQRRWEALGVSRGLRAAHGHLGGPGSGGLLPLGFQGAAGGWQQNAAGGELSHKHPDAPAPVAAPTSWHSPGVGNEPPFCGSSRGRSCADAWRRCGDRCVPGAQMAHVHCLQPKRGCLGCSAHGTARVALEVFSPWGLWPHPCALPWLGISPCSASRVPWMGPARSRRVDAGMQGGDEGG